MTWLEHLKLLVVVTAITGLVWLYAEGENVKSNTVTASLQLVAPPGADLEIRPAQPQTVQMTIRCSAAKLAEVQRRFQSGPVNLELVGDPSKADGRQVVVLRDALAGNSQIVKLGVNIVELQPATLEAFVDTKSQVTLQISVNTGDAQLAGAPTVVPKEVTLTVPSSLAAALRGTKLEARIDPQELAKREVAVPHTLDVDLTVPAEFRMTKTPPVLPRVKVTFTVRRLVETLALPLVPLRLDLSPADSVRFSVSLSPDDRFLRDLIVTGPADILERIRKREFEIWASLRLTTEELEKAATDASPVTKIPEITSRPPLPSTVTFEPAPRPIPFTIQAKP